ncbi:MAG: hypothetical protein LBR32_02900 [Propionibacteriaceae bacterium]|jgi:endonuclease/exonuclease/phosphatase family metal-dependent hydrolase|nr:hypothetical protein [Propionibacteriaceae bacterium]
MRAGLAALTLAVALAAWGCSQRPPPQAAAESSAAESAGAAVDEQPEATPSKPTKAAGSGNASAEVGSLAVKAMTYDILPADASAKDYPWLPAAELKFSARAPVLVDNIANANPGVVGLQGNSGSDPLPVKKLAAGLPDYAWAAADSDVPIAFKRARYKALDHGRAVIGGAVDGFSPSVAWVKLRDEAGGREFFVFNAHLPAGDDAASAQRRSSAVDGLIAVVHQADASLATPLVVLGDFATLDDEDRAVFADPLDKLAQLGLADAAQLAQKDSSDVAEAASLHDMRATIAGHAYAKVVPQTGRHVDYVFVPVEATVASWAVVSGPHIAEGVAGGRSVTVWEGAVASNHSPVVATVVFTYA